MSFDVFISYATKDKTVADAVCARLESVGIRCWIAPRDIVASTSYGEAIIDAIHGAKLMVLVFSANANASGHIPKEVERAVSNGVPILPVPHRRRRARKIAGLFHRLGALAGRHDSADGKTSRSTGGDRYQIAPRRNGRAETIGGAGLRCLATERAIDCSADGSGIPFRIGTSDLAVIRSNRGGRCRFAGRIIEEKTLDRSWRSHCVSCAAGNPVRPEQEFGQRWPDPGSDESARRRGWIHRYEPRRCTSETRLSPAPSTPAARTTVNRDPLVGCYHWFNNAPVVVHSNGVVEGGPFKGRWQVLNASQRTYRLMWPENVETYTLSPDQRAISGTSMYGYSVLASRTAGSGGLIGTWRWPNGALVTIYSNGTFICGPFNGTWKTMDASRGTYTITWPGPIDSIALDPSDTRLTGGNQYGIAVSGVRTEPCKTN